MQVIVERSLLVLLLLLQGCLAIYPESEQLNDITTNPEFGCRWFGGSSAALVCICRSDVEQFYIQENTIPAFSLETIRIDSCSRVRFGTNSINRIRNLRNVELFNIGNLQLDEGSLEWDNYISQSDYNYQWDLNIPSLRVTIEDTHIDQISSYTFKGRINSVVLRNVVVDNVAPFAFSSLIQNQNVQILDSRLRNVQAQAFKKFSTESLQIISSLIEFLPSRSFSEIEVNQNFLIQNCSFDTVRPSAFFISNPVRMEVTNSNFNQLDGEAFRVTTRGNVLFRGNNFNNTNIGAFRGITLNPEEDIQQTITFDSNNFNTLYHGSLTTSDTLTPKFINTVLNETCDCNRIAHIYDSEFYSEIHCFTDRGTTITALEFNRGCSIITSHATLIISVAVVLLVFVFVVAGLAFYFRKVRNSDKYGSEKTKKKGGKMSLIVPDGRTYRETELHVIVERADLLTTDL